MSSREFKIIAVISDIHIGRSTVSASDIKKQLKDLFLKKIEKFKYLDGIFITGDIMHTIVSMNSEYAEVFNWFISRVYHIAQEKHSTVIIVRGTLSHENMQLNNIKHYIDNTDGVDFRIYETAEEITLWKNYKILILPDNRVKDPKEIEKFFDKPNKYDIILGHGMIDILQMYTQESENFTTKQYVYDLDKLIESCKGPIFFGHIHQYHNIKRKFYYVGSFTTLERGVMYPGYLVCGISDENHSRYKVERVLNEYSSDYIELNISRELLMEYPLDDICEAIDRAIKDAKENDLVTLRVMLTDSRDALDKVSVLEERYRKDKRFSIVKKIKSKQEEEVEQKNEEMRSKYSYLINPSADHDIAPIIYRYYIEDVYPTLSDDMRQRVKLTEGKIRDLLHLTTDVT